MNVDLWITQPYLSILLFVEIFMHFTNSRRVHIMCLAIALMNKMTFGLLPGTWEQILDFKAMISCTLISTGNSIKCETCIPLRLFLDLLFSKRSFMKLEFKWFDDQRPLKQGVIHLVRTQDFPKNIFTNNRYLNTLFWVFPVFHSELQLQKD